MKMKETKKMKFLPFFTLFLASIAVESNGATNTMSGSCLSDSDIEPLVSGPKYRVHEQFFSTNLPESATLDATRQLDGNSWCSRVDITQQPWVGVEFGSEVVIHSLRTAGYDGYTGDYYVVSFQVYFGDSFEDMEPIVMPNSSVPMVFERPEGSGLVQTDLPRPVTTRVLRIVVLSWEPEDDELCIGLEALGCLGHKVCESESLLTADRTLLPVSSITASSPAEDSLKHLVDTNEEWCSTEDLTGDSPSPYVQLNFTRSVRLSHMTARGGSGLGFSYVTGFQLEVLDDAGNFVTYRVNDGDGVSGATVFTADSASEVLYTLWQPARGVVFRFSIVSGEKHFFNGDFCWNIKVFGCLDDETDNTTAVPVATTDLPIVNDDDHDDDDLDDLDDLDDVGTEFAGLMVTMDTTLATENSTSPPVIGLWTGIATALLSMVIISTCSIGWYIVYLHIQGRNMKTEEKSEKSDSRPHLPSRSPSITSLGSIPHSMSRRVENAIYGMGMKSTSPSPPPVQGFEQDFCPLPSVHTYESIHLESLGPIQLDSREGNDDSASAPKPEPSTMTRGFVVQADIEGGSVEDVAADEKVSSV